MVLLIWQNIIVLTASELFQTKRKLLTVSRNLNTAPMLTNRRVTPPFNCRKYPENFMNFVNSYSIPRKQFMTFKTASRLQEINKMSNHASKVHNSKVVTQALSSSNLQKWIVWFTVMMLQLTQDSNHVWVHK